MMFTNKKKSENESTSAPSLTAAVAAPSPTGTRPVQVSGSARIGEESRPSSRLEEISPPSPRLPSKARHGGAGASSTLNPHLSFEGNLKYSGSVTLDCDFRGSIVTDDTLVVGPSGKLNAEITAGVIEVSGKVHGNIKAKTRVRILTGGEVFGNIETPTISMDEGVVFEGNCIRPQASGQAGRSQAAGGDKLSEVIEAAVAAGGR